MNSTTPMGTVTFLFTDIEGSTSLWERHPAAMRLALEDHDALLRGCIEARLGHVFKTVGDAFCCYFASPLDALEAALSVMRALLAKDWTRFGAGFGPLRVRMGIHTGLAVYRDGDFYGPTVNLVSRIEATAVGGQILLSDATRQALADAVPDGAGLRDLGARHLRGVGEPQRLFALHAEGLPDLSADGSIGRHPDARDRVVVTQRGPQRSLADAQEALYRALVRESETVSFRLEELQALASRSAESLREHRLSRVAAWLQPQHRVDESFVDLSLLLDQGEAALGGRWQRRERRFEHLMEPLLERSETAFVLLGAPGAGKSTLLRRLELDLCIEDLVASHGSNEEDLPGRATFFVALSQHGVERSLDPRGWLAERWAERSPALPELEDLLRRGRMVLLLDGLNEIPHSGPQEYRERVRAWRQFLVELDQTSAGNRVIVSCRSLDYSQPLSTARLRVPQLRIEPLSDDKLRRFLEAYSPIHAFELWSRLRHTRQWEVLRSPFYAKLMLDAVESGADLPSGRAALIMGLVLRSIRREVVRENPLFQPGEVLSERDVRRLHMARSWPDAYDLPDRGPLVPSLSRLAYGMQRLGRSRDGSQLRVPYDLALELIDGDRAEDLLRAGEALALLEDDPGRDELHFSHQLVQEYFAARRMAQRPDARLLRSEWRSDLIEPCLEELIETLAPADRLPALPGTGWEETALMAAVMSESPGDFVEDLARSNLALGARAAGLDEVRARVPAPVVEDLRQALVARSRNPRADLRDRVRCGLALGELGDPRYERRVGPEGELLLPPLVEVAGGSYTIGEDEPIHYLAQTYESHMPAHKVQLAPFAIGRFPVTNAEWRCFMNAGGYEDERWWASPAARAWRRGETTGLGHRYGTKIWWERYRRTPEILSERLEMGLATEEHIAQIRSLLELSSEAMDRYLAERFPHGEIRQPQGWEEPGGAVATMPVDGLCWFEAQAYCRWLAAQTGLPLRLPSEVEWEAAARGPEGRRYPWGDRYDPLRCNTHGTHLQRRSPVGVFPSGDTPEGIADMIGNVGEWTSSLYGRAYDDPDFDYPYDPKDGREDLDAGAEIIRSMRGSSFEDTSSITPAAQRNINGFPDLQFAGMRIAMDCRDEAGG